VNRELAATSTSRPSGRFQQVAAEFRKSQSFGSNVGILLMTGFSRVLHNSQVTIAHWQQRRHRPYDGLQPDGAQFPSHKSQLLIGRSVGVVLTMGFSRMPLNSQFTSHNCSDQTTWRT
jgi:hypothetical protein